ncbi:MAG: glutamine-hydrolyzing carbamoyl-phosphate synthase small subunit [Clostridia bacterium]|nr:glutamine-hydrolyzing carbamoyl-phosphate synthase small subunit [Clostridia bacterium]
MAKTAYLVLSNGAVFKGRRIGAEVDRIGELVFTTGMEGYIETLTDPSYYGQIVTQSFPLIGNYGIIEEDFEGESALFGYVCREISDTPSNFRCQYTVDEYLRRKGIPGIVGVDTRQIVRITREEGVMNAVICSSVPEDLSAVRAYTVQNAVKSVTCAAPADWPAEGGQKHRVTLIDYGMKRNIVRSLQRRGCAVHVVPADTPAEKILAEDPDGIMLSNGPGDPKENVGPIAELKKLIGKKPVFGICLGHQLTALALGGDTVKLKYGHRGGNQPVRELGTGRTWITSQNHGYAVVADSLKGVGEESFVNANDGSCEGMRYPSLNCLTVQFHPEACSGPKDTGFLFDRFMEMMKEKK